MENTAPSNFPSLVLVAKEAQGVAAEMFHPKLIPLDHISISLTYAHPRETAPVIFACVEWDALQKRWCISGRTQAETQAQAPIVHLNGIQVVSARRDLRPDDVIRLERAGKEQCRSLSLSYRFHWPSAGCAPQLVNSPAAVHFPIFAGISRKRPRSEDTLQQDCMKPCSSSCSVLPCGSSSCRGRAMSLANGESRVAGEFLQKKSEEGSLDQLEKLRREHTCAICAELFYKTMTLECGHSFCKDCIDKWLACSLTCPICREVTAKPPFACFVSDKSVEVLVSSDEKLKKTFIHKKELSEARLKKSKEAQAQLNKLIMYARKSGHRLVSIGNPWSEREQKRFFRGALAHYGPAREAYCASVSLTYEFIENAKREQLLVALDNLSLKPADYKKDGEMDVKTVWSKLRTQALRTRLLMFVNWS